MTIRVVNQVNSTEIPEEESYIYFCGEDIAWILLRQVSDIVSVVGRCKIRRYLDSECSDEIKKEYFYHDCILVKVVV